MLWLLHRHGYFWPSILPDCIDMARKCRTCNHTGQRIGQGDKFTDFRPVIQPWPFRGWAMNVIKDIQPVSQEGYKFVIVIIDYFTKWVKAKAFRTLKAMDVVNFIKEFIFIRFGIPESLTVDQQPIFGNKDLLEFCEEYEVKLLNCTPSFMPKKQSQEEINRSIMNGITRMIADNPKKMGTIDTGYLVGFQSFK